MTKSPRPIRTPLSTAQLAQVRGGAYEYYVVIKGEKQGSDGATTKP